MFNLLHYRHIVSLTICSPQSLRISSQRNATASSYRDILVLTVTIVTENPYLLSAFSITRGICHVLADIVPVSGFLRNVEYHLRTLSMHYNQNQILGQSLQQRWSWWLCSTDTSDGHVILPQFTIRHIDIVQDKVQDRIWYIYTEDLYGNMHSIIEHD